MAPDRRQQFPLGDDVPDLLDQLDQQEELLRGERDVRPGPMHHLAGAIDGEVAEMDDVAGGEVLHQPIDVGDELGEIERLREQTIGDAAGLHPRRPRRNLALNRVRRQREFADTVDDGPADDDVGLEVERAIRRDAVYQELARLPPAFRDAVWLAEYRGMDCIQIAEQLHISPGAVRTRLARGRRLLGASVNSWA